MPSFRSTKDKRLNDGVMPCNRILHVSLQYTTCGDHARADKPFRPHLERYYLREAFISTLRLSTVHICVPPGKMRTPLPGKGYLNSLNEYGMPCHRFGSQYVMLVDMLLFFIVIMQ